MSNKKFYIYFPVAIAVFVVLFVCAHAYTHDIIYKMDDAKIEYKVGKETLLSDLFGGWKNVYWRVSNDELQWWLRPFNRWNKAYFVSSGRVFCSLYVPDGEMDATKYELFNTQQFKELKDKCHTLGEMKEYMVKSDKEFERWNYELRKKREKEEIQNRSKKEWENAVNN